MARASLLLAVLVVALPAFARGEKVDVVDMRNGDHVTCEIKELDRGRLRVKTDGMGTVYLEWDKVVRVSSTRLFEVQLTTGETLYGSLVPAGADGRVTVAAGTGPSEVALERIVRVLPQRSRFWGRFDGSLDLGGSYTQANSLLQLTPSFSTTYGGRAFLASFDFSGNWTHQEGRDDATRLTGTLSYMRIHAARWVGFGRGTVERNTELGLSLRGLVAGGVGRFLVLSSHSRFALGAGLSANRERPFEGDSASNLEGLLTAQWQIFTYSFPKTSLAFSFSFFPGLSDWGRVRGDVDLQLRREIIRDFTVGLRVYDSFDSRPATEGAANNDWGATLSLGWTF
jgi:hypothetical protein